MSIAKKRMIKLIFITHLLYVTNNFTYYLNLVWNYFIFFLNCLTLLSFFLASLVRYRI